MNGFQQSLLVIFVIFLIIYIYFQKTIIDSQQAKMDYMQSIEDCHIAYFNSSHSVNTFKLNTLEAISSNFTEYSKEELDKVLKVNISLIKDEVVSLNMMLTNHANRTTNRG